MKLSIVIPVYNGSQTIGPLVDRIRKDLAGLYELEIVLVNDGSPSDDSAQICLNLAKACPQVVFLDLSRNFGEHNAVMAGLNHTTGEVVAIMDDDFQNPPGEVAKLVRKLQEGYDVVFSSYRKKHHHPLRNLGSRFNNLVASMILGKPLDLYLSSFKVISRFVVDQVVKYQGPYPYIDGLILRVTRNLATQEVAHEPRREGRSGYTIGKLVGLWLNMFTSFSILPLRFATLMGFLFSFIGLIGAGVFFVEKLENPALPAGWASLIVSLFIISGVQLFTIGMVGEYLGRLFLKEGGNPQFVVRRSLNLVRRSSDHEGSGADL